MIGILLSINVTSTPSVKIGTREIWTYKNINIQIYKYIAI